MYVRLGYVVENPRIFSLGSSRISHLSGKPQEQDKMDGFRAGECTSWVYYNSCPVLQ